MSEASFSFQVDGDLKAQFSSAARARDQSEEELLRRFMRDFVQEQQESTQHDQWLRSQVQAGLDSANAGRLIANDEVEAEFSARRAQAQRRLDTGS